MKKFNWKSFSDDLGNLQWLLIGFSCYAPNHLPYYFVAGALAVGALRIFITIKKVEG